jgi:hypothetical protein
MQHMRTLFLFALTSIALPVAGQSSLAVRPILTAGDRWEYEFVNRRSGKPSCNYTLTVEKVSDLEHFSRIQYPDGCEIGITTAYPVRPGSLHRFDQDLNHYHLSADSYHLLQFPLSVGKSWRQRWSWSLNGWSYNDDLEATVEAVENITTKAGTFECFKIHLVRAYQGTRVGYWTQNGVLHDTAWYAPAVKAIVRRRSVDSKGGDLSRDLVDFKIH